MPERPAHLEHRKMHVCPKCGAENDTRVKLCQECGHQFDGAVPQQEGRISPTTYKDVRKQLAQILEGKYEIVSEVGRGGMAIVYKAIDLSLERIDAIKVLPVELAYDKEFVERFHREAKTAARLNHPNIITIYTVQRHGNLNFMIMKYIEGKTVKELIRESRVLTVDKTISIVKDTCQALFFAHKEGVIHRDIKPDNIMVDRYGNAVVMDFGIAKAVSTSQLTQTGSFLGTAAYMAPEQIRGKADHRADLYSLGIVMFKMLAGRVPFRGNDSYEIHYKHLHDEPPRVTKFNPLVSTRIENFLLKLLKKDADERFQSALEAYNELVEIERTLRGAETEFREARIASSSVTEEIGAYYTEAVKAFESHDYERAISLCEKLLSLDPSYIKAIEFIKKSKEQIEAERRTAFYLQEGKEYFDKGEYTDAIRSWGQVITLDADNTEAFGLIEQARKLIAQRDKLQEHLYQAEEAIEKQHFNEARRYLEKVLDLDRNHAKAKEKLHFVEEELRKAEEVERIIAEGRKKYEGREFTEAQASFARALGVVPNHLLATQWHDRVISSQRKLGNLREAIEEARQVLAERAYQKAAALWQEIEFLDPENTEAHESAKLALGKLEEQSFITRHLEDARVHLQEERLEQALDTVKKALERFPENKDVQEVKAGIQTQIDRRERSVTFKTKGLKAFEERQYEEALEALTEASKLLKGDDEVEEALKESRHILNRRRIKELSHLGKEAFERSDFAQAVAHYRTLRQLDSEYPGINEHLTEAEAALKRAETLAMLLQKAESLWEEGRGSEARADWEEAIALDLENADAKEGLSRAVPDTPPPPPEPPLSPEFEGHRRALASRAPWLIPLPEEPGNLPESERVLVMAGAALRESIKRDIWEVAPREVHYITSLAVDTENVRLPLHEDMADFTLETLLDGLEVIHEPLLYDYKGLDTEALSEEQSLEDVEFTQVSSGEGEERTQLFSAEQAQGQQAEVVLPFGARITKGLRENVLILVLFIVVVLAVGGGGYFAYNQHQEGVRKERIADFWAKVLNADAEGKFDLAKFYTEQLILLDPGNRQYMDKLTYIKGKIDDEKRKADDEKRKRDLLAQGRTAREESKWPECIASMKEFLQIEKDNLAAVNLLEECRAALEKEEYEKNRLDFLKGQFTAAGAAVKAGEEAGDTETAEAAFKEAEASIESIMSRETPESLDEVMAQWVGSGTLTEHDRIPALQERMAKARQKFEQRAKLQELVVQMRTAYKSFSSGMQQVKDAHYYAGKVLDLDSGNAEARKIKDEMWNKINAQNRAAEFQAQKTTAKNKVQGLVDAKQWPQAIEAAEKFLSEFGDDTEVQTIKEYSEAKIKEEASQADLLTKRTQAWEGADDLMAKAVQTRNYTQVLAKCAEVLAIDPTFLPAQEMLARAKQLDVDTDRTPPSISTLKTPRDPEAGKDIKVTVEVTDTGGAKPGVKSVTLHFRLRGSGSWKTTGMVPSGSLYSVTLSPTSYENQAGKIELKVTAEDLSGNQAESASTTVSVQNPPPPPPPM